ncbi:MAG: DUF4124 domain-containing protein [Gammaproteobacteria bacterium]|jgi:hypothetical protein
MDTRYFAGFLVALLAIGLLSSVQAATYKWVDKDGNVHYSDTPHEGAKRVDLPKVQSYNPALSQPAASPPGNGTGQANNAAQQGYREFTLTQPQPDDVIWADDQIINLSAALNPSLQPGDRVVFYYDGKPVGEPGTSLSTTVGDAYRGTHTARAAVVGSDGSELISTATVTFTVKHHSRLLPNTVHRPPRH